MPTLYLIRHAKSSWKDSRLDDLDRPLNSRGERDAPEMGRRLAARKVSADQIITSPALRAKTTAGVIAGATGFPAERIIFNEDVYLATPTTLLDIICSLDDAWQSVFIFGHNPGFTQLANMLCNAEIENVPTCGIVAVDFPGKKWVEIPRSNGKMLFFDFPKNKSDL
ncbi:MAG TPA: histidine phosphatase family protein [Calditrichia bacterium]|nr:histidine phosphatase family protein [Calditrichota bacterium]HQU71439.1 histidine phosphatase family protein [Calditrichia bacterium]HQV34077.1 histidine phosphatase family protein [Calditrichia bacterium]